MAGTFDGQMDEVRVYSRALDAVEVGLLYSSALLRQLVVQGDPAAYGSPSPLGYGTNSVTVSTAVTNSVAIQVSGGAGARYVCTGWTGTGDVPPTGAETTVTFTVTTDSTLTWNWRTEYYLDTGAGANGSVDVGDGWYTNGAVVAVTAAPSNGYQFAGWTGDLPPSSSASNPLTLTMNQARTVSAAFSWISPIVPPVSLYSPSDETTGPWPAFSWPAVTGAEKYRLEIYHDGRLWKKRTVKAPFWVFRKELPAGSYMWRVGTGRRKSMVWSPWISFTCATGVPAKGVAEAQKGTQPGTTVYTWATDPRAAAYDLRIDANGAYWKYVGDITGTSATIAGHAEGAYTWWVRGVNAEGPGEWSAPADFDVEKQSVAPLAR